MKNENKSNENTPLLLIIIDHDGNEESCPCDTVWLNCKNDKKDRNGGSLGIKKGHTKSVIALSKHEIKAFVNGQEIFKSDELSGIAKIEQNTITVLKD